MQADLVPAGQPGWSWPQALFWKLSISLPEVPLLFQPPLLFSFLTWAWGEIPVASMGDTSSSLAGGSQQLLQKVQQSPTHTGPPIEPWTLLPPTSPAPRLLTGQRMAENMASGTAAGAFAAWRVVYIDLNPGTPGKGWPAGSGCPGQPIHTHQGLTVAENGFCCSGPVLGTAVEL